MATPNVKRVAIELDKLRYLVFDLNAYCTVEDLTGKNFMKSDVWLNLTFKDIRALTFAGLRREDPTITIEQVGTLVNGSDLDTVAEAIKDAILGSMPEEKKSDAPLGEAEAIRLTS